jgi:SpoVK/Ycf46/Vps4 family AAA+-type ATPase
MMLDKIIDFIHGRTSLIYLVSEEEERVERMIVTAAQKATGGPFQLYLWSCGHGLIRGKDRVGDSRDLDACLGAFLRAKGPSILICKDLHLVLNGNPQLIRRLKDCARILRSGKSKVFFICPYLDLPQELFSNFKVEDVPLPGHEELSRILDARINEEPAAKSLRKSLTEDTREKMIRAAMGFTANEALDAFHLAVMNRDSLSNEAIDLILDQKQSLVRKSGILEFVNAQADTWEIGGLANLKKWLKERDEAFSLESAKYGLTPPKGILVMGVSGCGKSLCIKAIASYWRLPLLRLDMGRLYDGLAGPPEEAMRKAIKTAEAVAPCVFWIDEIEAGIANAQQKKEGGKEARVLALFLTWMQEKTAPVFVGATANEVEVLPPELLRKGRFDELFYMGLPMKDERLEIMKIHMRRKNVDPARYDLEYLATSTEGLNGAEIEQGVISALFEAKSQNEELSEHILANAFRNIVPLSRTMKERIQKIEAWARDRAMKASLDAFDKSS